MEITPDVNVHVEIATPSTDNTDGAFTVVGGVGITGDTNTLGYVAVEGIIFGGDDAKGFNTSADLTNPRMVVRNTEATNQSSFSQIAFQNSDPTSSTDFIVYMDNGVDAEGWLDFGIAGSEFDDTTYGITSPGDGYIFLETATDIVGPGYNGNLVLATGDKGIENKIVFAAGGFASGDTQMEITPGVNVHIEIPTASVSPSTGALTVVGGVGVQGDMNIQGDINIVGDLTFGGGSTTTETLGVTDPAIFVGVNNDADSVDLGLYIEYAPSLTSIVRSVDQKSLTSNVATLRTTAVHGFLAGDVVNITNVDATFNGTNINILNVPTTTTFTYAKTAADVSTTAVSPTGTATVTNRRKYGGIVRDASDGIFKLFTGATTTPTTTVNFSEAGVVFGDLRLNSLDLTVALPSADGGTGFSTYATGDLLYASATNTLSKLSAGTNGHLLTLSSGVPVWAAAPVSLPSQTGNAGELLTTDGTSATWGNTVTANAIGSVALIAKGLSGQTADIFQVQSNAATLVKVENSGAIVMSGAGGGAQKRGLSVSSGNDANGTGGIYILSGSAAGGDGATIEAIGRRVDSNTSRTFSGTVALGHLRTDAAITSTGQVLGSVVFGGNASGTTESSVIYSASIVGLADGTWSSNSAMPTALAFYTGSTGTALNTANANTGTERMRITSGGLVGIGTTPTAQLTVSGAGQTTAAMSTSSSLGGTLLLRDSGGLAGNGGAVIFAAEQGAFAAIKGLIFNGGGNTEGSIAFSTRNTQSDANLTERVRIDRGGNVGIGTSSPSGTLELGSSTLASLAIQTGGNSRYWLTANLSTNTLSFGGNGATAPASGAINIDGSANSTFTGQIISTRANSATTGAGQIYLNGTTGNRIDFNTAGIAAPSFTTRSVGTKIVLYPDLSAGNVDFAFGIEGSTLWQSIPNSSCTFRYYAGTTSIATLSGGGNFTVNGNVTAFSDERLKSNIKTIDNALEKVSKLRGVSFDKDGEKGIGVIAQEVQKVLPEVVLEGEYLSVAYGNIVGLLIEAIKEQQEQIEDLKKRLG
jgi:hypothetical protein